MPYREDDYLQVSGIQHFAFCRRQWALIHIEEIWSENWRTTEGKLLHEKAHDAYRSESRGEVVITRAVPIHSPTLGLSGECDIVELRRDDKKGVPLRGHDGKYRIYPVEYKRGSPKEGTCDLLQLTAQAMCLEEMLCCTISEGALYYFEVRRRQHIVFTEDMRNAVRQYTAEMHDTFSRRYLPKPHRTKSCNACSLHDECLPKLEKTESAKAYNDHNFSEEDDT